MSEEIEKPEDYIITKRTSIGERKGVNWKRLNELEKKMWLDHPKEFSKIKREVLIEAKKRGILKYLQKDSFFMITNEGYTHPIINCESYGFDNEEELREYSKVFHQKGNYRLAIQIAS